MPFINKVLLPMIRNEMTVPICISERKRIGGVNADSLSANKSSATASLKLIPSELIEMTLKPDMIKATSEVLNQASSEAFSTYNKASWEKIRTSTND